MIYYVLVQYLNANLAKTSLYQVYSLRWNLTVKCGLSLNLKKNLFINTNHFKLEDLWTAIKLVTQDCYMATLNLKDAYFLIKIHEDSKKYLRFIFDGKLYQFNVLPFGLNTASFVFTKITKPIVKLLRTAGLIFTL